MIHWIGRVNLLDGKLKPLEKVDSESEAWDRIHELNSIQDAINKTNNKIYKERKKVKAKIPCYNKELHGNIKAFMLIKKQARKDLSLEDKETLAIEYLERVIPLNHKLVYLAVHEDKP